jgi:hypothetical protein
MVLGFTHSSDDIDPISQLAECYAGVSELKAVAQVVAILRYG